MGKDQDLIQAVKDNDTASVAKIIQKLAKTSKTKIIGNNKKLNINFQDGDGMSALHQASLMGSTDVIKLLVEAGASSDLRDNKGMVALHYATWQGRPEPVQALLLKQPPVNEQALNGETPLHLACQHGHIHVVKLLLSHHADPTICNKDLKTPLDLACEFGRCRVVEQLLKSNLCEKLLEDSPTDTLDNSRTTCLHLAAKNGHSDIIRLLIQNGMNINRATLSGTCLHEAALYGKIDVVKLLLDCGVDVNKPNSYDQTALDIVNKFTTSRAARELKQLLKEASFAVQARAVKDYFNVYDPQSLAFKEGDIITVLEQRGDGQWKGYVVQEGKMAKTGVFPANHVVLVDGQALKQQQQQQQQQQQTKGPQVPDLLSRGPHFNHNGHLHNGFGSDTTSLSSSSTDDSYPPPPNITHVLGPPPSSAYTSYPGGPPPSPGGGLGGAPPPPQSPAHMGYGGPQGGFGSYGAPPASPGYHQHPAGQSAFGSGYSGGPPPASPGYLSSSPAGPFSPHKDIHESLGAQHSSHIVNKGPPLGGGGGEYHGGEWPGPGGQGGWVQVGVGGDMRGVSPGKEHVPPSHSHNHSHSPAHSNRNSAASSDSGRGFSTGHLEPKVVTVIGQHRLSDQSYESGVSSRQSYHSTSSSSVGSLDRLEESGHVSTINVQQLIQAGVPDKEVLHAWLHDLHFEDYYTNFVQAGYDMPTISRMTPEDLTAIGITKPAHRKRLKAEIARLHIHDGIPDFCPHDLIEWLHLLGLGMYHETLAGQGYDNIQYVTDITWEDLEEIGIKKLGHQKKIMLAIDRLKRITSASKRLSTVEPRRSSIEMLEPPPPAPPIGRWSGEISSLPPHMYEGGLGVGAKPKKSPSGDSISTTGSGGSGSNSSQSSGEMRNIPLPREDAGVSGGMPLNRQASLTTSSQSDVIAIQVKRQGRSSTSDEAGQQSLYQSFQGPAGGKVGGGEFPGGHAMSTSDPGLGIQMLPRVQQKPVAKIIAKTRQSSRENSPDAEMEKHESENNSDGNKMGPMSSSVTEHGEMQGGGTLKRAPGPLRVEIREHIYDQPQVSPKSGNTPSSPKPQLVPKPASPLHVATHHNPSVASSGSPTGRNKKAPPPPPKRTHSIRNDSTVSKVEASNTFSVTTTASMSSTNSSGFSNSSAKNTNSMAVPPAPSTGPAAGKQESSITEKTQPQTEAFASCVKSLSERFGSKKSETEGSQESLSSDSDEFPPPPPPIAMDIITPKIRNYGIPSKSDLHHSPLHVREYGMHSHHSTPSKDYVGSFQSRLKTLQASEGGSSRPDGHTLSASVSPLRRISPGRDIPATSTHHDRLREAEAHSSSPSLGDKRSESTTSFDSTVSTSSTDSNTLPFANENVGTIKQRAAAMKPSIVQSQDSGDGQRNVDLNTAMFDTSRAKSSSGDMHRTTARGASSEGVGGGQTCGGYPRTVSADGASGAGGANGRSSAPGMPHSMHVQTVASASSKVPGSSARVSQSNHGASSEGPRRPPLPDKKPSLAAAASQQPQTPTQPQEAQQQHTDKRPQPQVQASLSQQQSQSQQQHVQSQPSKAQLPDTTPQTVALSLSVDGETTQRQSSDVLSDIDNMLQGLTDELDAMLLEESEG
ncbi:LOW QUALITY PROTEIN: uncharacterized protein LOC143282697 [Babylonia areolata]|uniref:LOW QUALITY PROTEIN: uncharacterized protein LOC143282697 n=1 Tax=Babylonia areolata TaxID=304850 RepID=UPI003FD11CD4